MKHVHHDMIVEWAADPSQEVEFLVKEPYFESSSWMTIKRPTWNPEEKYRFKPAEPKYIVVNGVNVPEPVREPLKECQQFWLADICESAQLVNWYCSSETHARWLSLGLIHLTREAAQAHIDAMLLPSRTDK
jgi:hypothetical protein